MKTLFKLMHVLASTAVHVTVRDFDNEGARREIDSIVLSSSIKIDFNDYTNDELTVAGFIQATGKENHWIIPVYAWPYFANGMNIYDLIEHKYQSVEEDYKNPASPNFIKPDELLIAPYIRYAFVREN